ncbi:MAG: hypothetical protein ACI4L5_02560 [Negativibacillus sp.]
MTIPKNIKETRLYQYPNAIVRVHIPETSEKELAQCHQNVKKAMAEMMKERLKR